MVMRWPACLHVRLCVCCFRIASMPWQFPFLGGWVGGASHASLDLDYVWHVRGVPAVMPLTSDTRLVNDVRVLGLGVVGGLWG